LRDLQGAPAYRIADDLSRPVWLADGHGGIDALLSTRLVSRRNAEPRGQAASPRTRDT
jgi:hypothetical protein